MWLKSIYTSSILILCVFATLCGQSDTTSLIIGQQDACKGDTLNIAVTVENFNNVNAFQFKLNWPPNQVRYISHSFPDATLNAQIEDLLLVNDNNVGAGDLLFQWVDLSSERIRLNLTDGDTLLILTAIVDEFTNFTRVFFDATNPAEIVKQDVRGNNIFSTTNTIDGAITFTNRIEVTADPGNLSCRDDSLTLSAQARSENALFEWTGPDGFRAFSKDTIIRAPGVYQVIARDRNCIDTAITVVTIDTFPPANLSAIGDTLDCATTEVQLSAISDSTDLRYEWLSPSGQVYNEPSPIVVESGTYELLVENNSNGCQAIATAEVPFVNNFPDIQIQEIGQLDCSSDVMQLLGISDDTAVIFSWQLPNGTTIDTTIISVQTAGNHILRITDPENGCVSRQDIFVREQRNFPTISVTDEVSLNCRQEAITLTGTSTSDAVSFAWLDSVGNILSNNEQLLVEAQGAYEFVVIDDATACESRDTVIVTDIRAIPDLSLDRISDTLTCVKNRASFAATTSIENPIFSWTDTSGAIVSTDAIFNTPMASNYQLTLFNPANACADTITVIVSQDTTKPQAQISLPDTITCCQADVELNILPASNAFICAWEGNMNCTQTVNAAGIYNGSVTNPSNGCRLDLSIEVFENTLAPTISPSTVGVLSCNNDTVRLLPNQAVQNITYEWTDADGNVVENGIARSAGMYIVEATDTSNGCSQTASLDVETNFQTPNLTIPNRMLVLSCQDSALVLEPNEFEASLTAFWADVQGNVIPNATVRQQGTYYLTVENISSGCVQIDSVEVVADTDIPQFTILPPLTNRLDCQVTAIELTATGAASFQYEWLDENNAIISTDTTVGVSEAGNYTLRVFNPANNCENISNPIAITQDTISPTFTLPTSAAISCINDTVTLKAESPNPDVIFDWLDFGQTDSLLISVAGNYIITAMDTSNQCQAEGRVVEVTGSSAKPVLSANEVEQLTCTRETVSLSVNSSIEAVTYEWRDGSGMFLSDDTTLIVSQAGSYEVMVSTSDEGCERNLSLMVLEDKVIPSLAITGDSLLTCTVTSIDLMATTDPTATIVWQDEMGNTLNQDPILTVTDSENYIAIATGTNGCEHQLSVNVREDRTIPIFEINAPDTIDCVTNQVLLTAQSFMPNVVFDWLNFGRTDSILVEQSGTYFVIALNIANGCQSAQQTVEVVGSQAIPELSLPAQVTLNCINESVDLSASVNSAVQPLSFTWQDETGTVLATIPNLNVATAGIYTLLAATPFEGCESSASVEVIEDKLPPELLIEGEELLTCSLTSIELSAISPSEVTIQWQNSNNDTLSLQATLSIDTAGSYTASATNPQNGCQTSLTKVVQADQTPPTATLELIQPYSCATGEAVIGVTEENNYQYFWTSEKANTILAPAANATTVTQPGMYTLLITNPVNDCMSAPLEIEVLQSIPKINQLVIEPIQCDDPVSGSIQVIETVGGEAPYFYGLQKNNLSTNPIFDNLQTGTYKVFVQDFRGCESDTTIVLAAPQPQSLQVLPAAEVVVPLGDSILLSFARGDAVTDYNSIQWFDADGLICADCLTYAYQPIRPALFRLEVIDENNCLAEATISVRVEEQAIVYIPTAFSPNGDGINDNWSINTSNAVQAITQIAIYNRWGELVFETTAPDTAWDGMQDGAIFPAGTYVATVEVELIDGRQKTYIETINLMR